jgi:hypothetical protein
MTGTVHAWHAGDMKTAGKFWSENRKERDHLKDIGVNGENIKMDLRKTECQMVCIQHL